MGNLLLNSLEVTNFRSFPALSIEHLGQVNVITGKNSVGKTNLLEALYLYAYAGHPYIALSLIKSRDEESGRRNNRHEDDKEDIQQALALKYLFYGRQDFQEEPQTFSIGTLPPGERTLTVSIGWFDDQANEQQKPKRRLLTEPTTFQLMTQMGAKQEHYNLIENLWRYERQMKSPQYPCILIPANGLSRSDVEVFWDNITLTPQEQTLIEALQIIDPHIAGLSFVGDYKSLRYRSPVVKMSDSQSRLPLRSLGEGINRVLGIMLALLNSQGGMLLIDEIESGLHYSVQTEMWKMIRYLATTLNIQVFATTHSWDCIEALQMASQEHDQTTTYVIRLDRKEEAIVPTLFDQRRLAIATREQIEVR
jgi:predicted ATPase